MFSTPSENLCRRFSLDEILSATNKFDDSLIIGKGGFGTVYKGIVDNGASIVAMKRLNPLAKQGAPEFWTEINMVSRFRHSHLVSLIGYCDDNNEMIFVYEYMIRGTLADHLYKIRRNNNNNVNNNTPLSWVQRLKICIGAARGLDYLHTGTAILQSVIHRDVKSSNILLDENWAAKVSDFGLSRIGPVDQECTHVSTKHIKGTFGYMDPDYFLTHRFTRKSDVYSFGVVLLEVLCERPALDRSLLDEDQWGLAGWGQQCIQEGASHRLIGPNLKWEILPNSLMEFVQIADQCLHSRPKKRPTMSEVVVKLELALALQLRKDVVMDEDLSDTYCPFDVQENTDSYPEGNQFIKIVQLGDSSSKHLLPSRAPVVLGESSKEAVENKMDTGDPERTVELQFFNRETPVFDYNELMRASAEVLGKGKLGTTYKAMLESGLVVAVKRLKETNGLSKKEFIQQMQLLGKMRHENLVEIVSFHYSKEEKLVIYEYLPHGSLFKLLHENRGTGRVPLDWTTRLSIIKDIAKGLFSLHQSLSSHKVPHANLKSSNVFICRPDNESQYQAKLSDFGFLPLLPSRESSKKLAIAKSPEFCEGKKLTYKADVYCFGIILLEIITGKIPGEISGHGYYEGSVGDLSDWVRTMVNTDWSTDILDMEILAAKEGHDKMLKLTELALECTDVGPEKRPKMSVVLRQIEEIEVSTRDQRGASVD